MCEKNRFKFAELHLHSTHGGGGGDGKWNCRKTRFHLYRSSSIHPLPFSFSTRDHDISHRPTQSRRRRYACDVANSGSNSCGGGALLPLTQISGSRFVDGYVHSTAATASQLPLTAPLARPADRGNAKANQLCSLPVNRRAAACPMIGSR